MRVEAQATTLAHEPEVPSHPVLPLAEPSRTTEASARLNLLLLAQTIPLRFGLPQVHEVYAQKERELSSDPRDVSYLELAYGTVLTKNINLVFGGKIDGSVSIDPNQVVRLTRNIDPGVFQRVQPETAFVIVTATEFSDREHVVFDPSIKEEAGSSAFDKKKREGSAQDSEFIASLFQQYHKLVLRIAQRWLEDDEDGEDLVQNIFLKLLTLDSPIPTDAEHQKAWIIKLTQHQIANELRSRYAKKRGGSDNKKNERNSFDPGNPLHQGVSRCAEHESLVSMELERVFESGDCNEILQLSLAGFSLKTEVPLLLGLDSQTIFKKLRNNRETLQANRYYI